jgi:hypothetical protein
MIFIKVGQEKTLVATAKCSKCSCETYERKEKIDNQNVKTVNVCRGCDKEASNCKCIGSCRGYSHDSGPIGKCTKLLQD